MKVYFDLEDNESKVVPINVANALISARIAGTIPLFELDELQKISEFLSLYCKHNRKDDSNE